MPAYQILYPIFALAAWTGLILATLGVLRIRALQLRRVRMGYFELLSGEIPQYLQKFGRNFNNLLEVPILFYTVCTLVFITGNVDQVATSLAWAYVLLRIVHSLIHITVNNVNVRFTVFVLSCIALGALWVRLFMALQSTPTL